MIYACPKCDHRRADPFPKRKGIPVCQGACYWEAMNALPTLEALPEGEVVDKPYDPSDRPEPEPVKRKSGRPKGAKDVHPRTRRSKKKVVAKVVRKAGVKKK